MKDLFCLMIDMKKACPVESEVNIKLETDSQGEASLCFWWFYKIKGESRWLYLSLVENQNIKDLLIVAEHRMRLESEEDLAKLLSRMGHDNITKH